MCVCLSVVIFFMGTVKWPPVDDFWGGQGLFGIYFGDVCVGGEGGSFSKILGEVQFLCKLVGGFPMF